jgi:hypothetical protein
MGKYAIPGETFAYSAHGRRLILQVENLPICWEGIEVVLDAYLLDYDDVDLAEMREIDFGSWDYDPQLEPYGVLTIIEFGKAVATDG